MERDTRQLRSSKRRSTIFSPAWFSRLGRRMLMRVINRVDCLGVMLRLGHAPEAAPFREQFATLPDSWPQKDQVKQLAMELTLAEVRQRGEAADPAQVQRHLDSIATWYDHQLHREAAPALARLMNHFFSHHHPLANFLSADRRELAHLDQLKAYQEQGLGVAYLCNHSSHLDEFITVEVLHQSGMKLPLFAAGANMMAIPSLAKILMLGSYVVQRRGGERMYLTCLHNYCRALCQTGGQQGIFLEAWAGGARSRDGSLRYPRRLVTLRGTLAGDKDLVIQPVAISYNILPEDLSLCDREGPLCWVRGMGFFCTLGRMLAGPFKGLWRSSLGLYGRAYCNLPKPRLLSELRQMHQADPSGLTLDEFVALYAMREIAREKKITVSQLTARGIMRAQRKRDGDLVTAVNDELEALQSYHQSAFGQGPDLEDFIASRGVAEVAAQGVAMLKRRAVLRRFGRDEKGLPRVRSLAALSFYATHGDHRLYSPTAKENLVVVGAGDWGFALASLVGNRILEERRYLNASLTLFDSRPEVATEMGVHRSPPGRFKEHRLPKNVFVTSDPPSAFRKATEVILALPPQVFVELAGQVLANLEQPASFMILSTGFDPGSHRLPCQVLREMAAGSGRQVDVYVLAGPVSDEDVVLGRPARGVLAGPPGRLQELADLFAWPPIELETSQDPVGVQLAAFLSRVYTLWGGYLQRTGVVKSPAQMGHFMVRASREAISLALAMGGQAETFSSSSIAWTANFLYEGITGPSLEFGRRLGASARRSKDVPAAAAKLYQTTETGGRRLGAYQDLRLAYLAAQDYGVEMPVLSEAFQTIWGERNP